MNVIIQIQGRDAIPVRAIPLLTYWRFMSPDIVAHVLGGTGGSNVNLFGDLESRDLESYRVENGQVHPIRQDFWVKFVLPRLLALTKKIAVAEPIYEVGCSEWQEQSIKELPAGVFVWKDVYQRLHDKNWNDRFRMNFCTLRDWNMDGEKCDTDEDAETQMQRALTRDGVVDDDPLRRDLWESLQVLKRWEKPDYSPFMDSVQYTLVMEGFERPSAQTPATPSTVVAVGASSGVLIAEAGPTAEAPAQEPRGAATGPTFSMTKAALIAAHEHEWPSIAVDIAGAANNGLKAAKAGARGWYEEIALEWARAKGKLNTPVKPANELIAAVNSMANVPGRKYIQER